MLRILIRTTQTETNELIARLAAAGHSVSSAYIALLATVDTEGTRLGTIAKRLGTSSQAVSQLVNDIEAKGYLERSADPLDGRAVIVRHTPAGRVLLSAALTAMSDIEAGYEQIIGERRMRQLKRDLTIIADAVDTTSRLAHP